MTTDVPSTKIIEFEREIKRKGWFEAITSDISFYDGFLDLIDNAVDSVYNENANNKKNWDKCKLDGYKIEITTKENSLIIKDNMGGMSPKEFKKAFTAYEKHSEEQKIIGKYGIGLQRSLHKLGKEFSVTTWKDKFECSTGIINRKSLEKKSMKFCQSNSENKNGGSEIHFYQINEEIKQKLNEHKELIKDLGIRYGKIINKNLKIFFNGSPINKILLIPERRKEQIKGKVKYDEFDARSENLKNLHDDWNVDVKFGSLSKAIKEKISTSWDPIRKFGGWYIFFNGRCVILSDTTKKTGWGLKKTAERDKIPRFHGQYRDFLGVANITTNDTSSLPLDSAKSNVLSTQEGYKKLIEELSRYNKEWTSSIRKNSKTELPSEPKKPKKPATSLFPENWNRKPKGMYSACFARAIKEGQQFTHWEEYPLASICLIRVTIELALRQTLRYFDAYKNEESSAIGDLKKAYGRISMDKHNESMRSDREMRASAQNAISNCIRDLNSYMHNEYKTPTTTRIKDIINSIDPFIVYASNLKFN